MASELTRTDSYQWPVAHLGHLSGDQQAALEKFKKLVESRGYYAPAGANGRRYASHDDETLLRFLRARKFSPEEAFKQFKDTEDWRKETQLERLYETIEVDDYEETRRLYPQWTGRRDRRGIPVYVFEVAHLDSKKLGAYQNSVAAQSSQMAPKGKASVPIRMLRLFALYENLTRFVLPLCSAMRDRPHVETPISQSNNIVDISKVGLKQFWNLKTHMQDASQLATAHYPETLDRIFIIGAPSFFPTVWGWIKRWFDPITVSKIFILSNSNMQSTLEKYIEPDNIPKKYGGNLDFEYGGMPRLDPAISDVMELVDAELIKKVEEGRTWSFPKGPIKWRQGKGKEMEAVAVGSEKGKLRDRPIARIPSDHQEMYGIARENTPIDWSLERVVSTPGTATQPTEEGDLYFGAESSPGISTSVPQLDREASMESIQTLSDHNLAEAISNDTTSAPAQPHPTIRGDPVSSSQPRTGTSDTRAMQAGFTHASGQDRVERNTPHIVDYGHGETTVTVESATVGQAPKDPFVNIPEPDEQEAPSAINHAIEVAGHAYSAAADVAKVVVSSISSAGGGGDRKEGAEKPTVQEPESDQGPHPDERRVEEFLRDQYQTQSGAKGK